MECLKNKKDTPDKQMDFLLGQSGGFKNADFKLYYLSTLCLQQKQQRLNCSRSDVKDKTDDAKNEVVHICDNPLSETCGCSLFKPKEKLPAILFQQTYNKWKAILDMNFKFRQIRKKRVIYLQPLEVFPEFMNTFSYFNKGVQKLGFFNFLRDFLAIYFMGFEVKLLGTKLISEYGWNVKQRQHHKTQKDQLLVSDIFKNMKKVIPKDGYCMLSVTWTDLYPSEDLNFVLGQASSLHSSAVFCFGRYEPKAYVGEEPPPPIEAITGRLIWRMIKVISHETCHLYSIQHCVFFDCSMNESSSLEEALSQPLFMCPVCIRKIQKVCQFDLVERYESLLEFLMTVQEQYPSDYAAKAITWLQKCITYLAPDTVNLDKNNSVNTHL